MNVDKFKMIRKKNNKGWIRIAEAFIAVLIVLAAAIIVVGEGIQREDISEKVYDIEIAILMEIQLNNTLRSEILDVSIPLEWGGFPQEIKDKIIAKTPEWLECVAKICSPESTCLWGEEPEKNVYVQSVLITSTLDDFNPRQLKLFCWEE